MFKSGFVTIAGKPNVGKSTLLNALVGEKVAIVSWRPQTTRNKINGILNGENYQIVFVDTPGIHEAKNTLSEYMMKSVKSALDGVDAVIYVISAEKRFDDKDKDFILSYKKNVSVIVVINKVDAVEKKVVFELMRELGEMGIDEIIPTSAVKGDNVDILKNTVVDLMKEGEAYYPEDEFTDLNMRFMAGEIIREKAMRLLNDEVPYGICVNIMSYKEEENITKINADIVVEKKAHKPIVIGKGGSMLKKIGTEARRELERFTDGKIYLELFVKVKEEWRDNSTLLSDFGYDDKEL